MRRAAERLALALALCMPVAAQATPLKLYTTISAAEFESLLMQKGAKVWRTTADDKNNVHVRIMDAETFEVHYWGCSEAKPPADICAYSIDRVYRKLWLTPEQANRINQNLALGRLYIATSNANGRSKGDVVLDYTVSLGKGVSADYIVGSFGEMIQGIEDHFEAGLDKLGLPLPKE